MLLERSTVPSNLCRKYRVRPSIFLSIGADDRMESRWTKSSARILRKNYLTDMRRAMTRRCRARWRLREKAGNFLRKGAWSGYGVAWVSLARIHDGCWTLAAEMERRRRCCNEFWALRPALAWMFRRSLWMLRGRHMLRSESGSN